MTIYKQCMGRAQQALTYYKQLLSPYYVVSIHRVVAHHPETGKEIRAGIGRFGQYIVCDSVFKSLPAAEGQCSLVTQF
jgi:Topoisomerase C-terminal repeat